LELKLRLNDVVFCNSFTKLLNLFFFEHNCRDGSVFDLFDIGHQLLVFSCQGEQVSLSRGASRVGESPVQIDDLLAAVDELLFLAIELFDQILTL
jgi:hypothetical protein